MAVFHPSLVSDKLVDTVNFYEDFFGFKPAIEKDGYVLLQQETNPDICLAVYDKDHECVVSVDSVKGLILNLSVKDVPTTYENLYMEGLEIFKELGTDIHGRSHFVVTDPNGVFINVTEHFTADAFIAA